MKIEKDNITQEVVEKFIKRRFSQDCNWTTGNCYFFAKILQARFPEGRIWYEVFYGHFVYEIQGQFYDWTGKIESTIGKQYIPWDELDEYDPYVKDRIIRDCIM